jgi:molybdopterin molybdotransferase
MDVRRRPIHRGVQLISKGSRRDVRLEGFDSRSSFDDALGWINSHSQPLNAEEVSVATAAGRVLARTFLAPADQPSADTAEMNGYALRSAETIGAGGYNPLPFSLQQDPRQLNAASALLISSGAPMPLGADAIASFEVVRAAAATIEVIEPVTCGAGVNSKGQEAQAGAALIDCSRPLRPTDLGLLASFGVTVVEVVRRPRVRLIIAGCKFCFESDLGDANGPMLRALIGRDGGVVEPSADQIQEPPAQSATPEDSAQSVQSTLAGLMAKPGADLVLVCGLTGTGPDDVAPLALDAAGSLDVHGIALHPGGSAGLGRVGETPVILLPGSPLHCLCAYDLLAGRLIRRLGGRSSQLPYVVRQAVAGRKIVSSIGNFELVQVRLVSGEAVPLGSAGSGGLAAAARADGFVLVPAPLEGYRAGAPVHVYIYDQADTLEGGDL